MISPSQLERSVLAELERHRGDPRPAGSRATARAQNGPGRRASRAVGPALAGDHGPPTSGRGKRRPAGIAPAVWQHTRGERGGAAAVRCSACGLVVASRTAALAPRYCPRCLARRHLAVDMQRLPTALG